MQSQQLRQGGLMFYKIGFYRQAAQLMIEGIWAKPDDPGNWCGLGSALIQLSMGRSRFKEVAARAHKRCLALPQGGEFHKVSQDWLNKLGQENPAWLQQAAMKDEELASLFKEMNAMPKLFVGAMKHIDTKDHMFVIMTVGDLGKAAYEPVMLAALQGSYDDGCVRAALKRIIRFQTSPAITQALKQLEQSSKAEEYEPYLSHAIRHFEKQPSQAPDV